MANRESKAMEDFTYDKYELTDETITVEGKTLYRIRALRDFGDVKAGDIGGYVESTNNLDNKQGKSWIYENAMVYGNARVYAHAKVYGNAKIYGNAVINGKAEIFENAEISDSARIYGCAKIHGSATVSKSACITNGDIY